MSVYEPIAAAWEHAERSISLDRWIEEGDDLLILGNDEAARVALDAVNQALFKRMTELALSQPDRDRHSIENKNGRKLLWLFLDEVREAGRLDGLGQLMNKGRSKGVGVILGFQDIDGLRAVYGTEIAQELTGQCQQIAILQLNNPSTARWAAEMFGAFLTEVSERSHSQSLRGEMNVGQQRRALERALVYTGDLMYLPRTTPQNGLTGYFRSPHLDYNEDSLKQHLNWERDIAPYRLPGGSIPDFLPRPVAHHVLKPWTEADFTRLGFLDPVPSYAPGMPAAPPAKTKATSTSQASPPESSSSEKDARGGGKETSQAEETTESVQDVLARLKERKKRK